MSLTIPRFGTNKVQGLKGIKMTDITIYHNPACGTSRNTLAMIHNSGVEPKVILYLETPPTRDELVDLIKAMGMSVRDLLRKKGTPYDELGLDNPAWTDEELIDFMWMKPILVVFVSQTAFPLLRRLNLNQTLFCKNVSISCYVTHENVRTRH